MNKPKPNLSHELHQARRLLQRKQQSGMQKLCKIDLTLPVSSAASERSFSALKLIKTHLRTTMTDDRLSHIGVLSIEARRAWGFSCVFNV